MLTLSPVKLLIVGVVAMLLLGPDKLPQVARQVGGAWRSFRDFQVKIEKEVRNSLPDLPKTQDLAKMARSPVALLNSLAEMPVADDLEPAVPDAGAVTPMQVNDNTPWPADSAVDVDAGASASRAAKPSLHAAWTGSDTVQVPDDPSMN